MMTLSQDVLKLLDSLSVEQLDELRHEIDQRTQPNLRVGTMNIDAVLHAADQITADMHEDDIRTMIEAMNEESLVDLRSDMVISLRKIGTDQGEYNEEAVQAQLDAGLQGMRPLSDFILEERYERE